MRARRAGARGSAGRLVTTVFDLMLAQYGVGAGDGPAAASAPTRLRRRRPRRTRPPGRSSITGVPAAAGRRIAREFAANAEDSNGRSMILMGAGTNHWFHSDTIYRAVPGAHDAHRLPGASTAAAGRTTSGRRRCRPSPGFAARRSRLDWHRPPRQMIHTAYWYLHTDQYRYDTFGADDLAAPAPGASPGGRRGPARAVGAAGWMPSYPTFNRNPLDLADDAEAAGRPAPTYVADELKAGRLRFAGEDPDARGELPPRADAVAREPARLLGKGNEYFLTTCSAPTTPRARPRRRRTSGRRTSCGARRRPRASSTCC